MGDRAHHGPVYRGRGLRDPRPPNGTRSEGEAGSLFRRRDDRGQQRALPRRWWQLRNTTTGTRAVPGPRQVMPQHGPPCTESLIVTTARGFRHRQAPKPRAPTTAPDHRRHAVTPTVAIAIAADSITWHAARHAASRCETRCHATTLETRQHERASTASRASASAMRRDALACGDDRGRGNPLPTCSPRTGRDSRFRRRQICRTFESLTHVE